METVTKAKPGALIGFFALLTYGIVVIYLINFGSRGTFESANVFFVTLVASGVISAAALKYQKIIKWFDIPQKKDWYYLPLGYAGMMAAAFILGGMGGSLGILAALSVGGVILSYQLYKTESILIPIFTHALYNITAIVLAAASVIPLSTSPIYVPTFGVTNITPANFISQAGFQFIATAPAEEMLRLSVASGAVLLFRTGLKLSYGIAIATWVAAHTALSYHVTLPF